MADLASSTHPVFQPGRVAVITGAASGIGLSTAEFCAAQGMHLCLADNNADGLESARARLAAENAAAGRQGRVMAVATDVSQRPAVQHLKDEAYAAYGAVHFLMNNAGREGAGQIFGDPAVWDSILGVNLMGVIHGTQAFAPAMIAQGGPAAIVNTGSKQGITCPPGNTAYNVSKAGVKVLTEGLAHELRNTPGCAVTAHLLVPGFTFTGLTRAHTETKPAGAWEPWQVTDFMVRCMEAGDFYIICPDNDVSRDLDNARMLWAALDIVENRPPLSRWHPDHAEAFRTFLAERGL